MSRILVVDDRTEVRNSLQRFLQHWGYDVSLARNGREALDAYDAEPSDLVVMDMFMPVMNGFDAIVEFRRRFPSVRILGMSGGGEYVREDALSEAKRLGADAMIAKPFLPEALLEAVCQVLVPDPG